MLSFFFFAVDENNSSLTTEHRAGESQNVVSVGGWEIFPADSVFNSTENVY